MLTDQEMLQIAERFTREIVDQSIEPMIYQKDTIKKPYGNIYFFDSKEYVLTGDFNKSLVGGGPFLVENKNERVVTFGTSVSLDDNIKDYENGTMDKSLDLYWYPDEVRFDYK